MIPDIPILIVGRQLTGASIGHNLKKKGVSKEDIVFFDAMIRTRGSINWIPGTQGPELPVYTKFVSIFDESGYYSLSHKLGRRIAQGLYRVKKNGLQDQLSIAEGFNKNLVRNLGTVVLSNGDDDRKLKEEYNTYKELGFESTLDQFDQDTIERVFATAKNRFTKGLFVPEDFIIDIEGYVNALLSGFTSNNFFDGHIVDYVEDKDDHVIVHYSVRHGDKIIKEEPITAGKVVFATNGFYTDDKLKGLLRTYWNYVICFEDEGENTPNGFYIGKNPPYFTRQDNILIVGGQDVPVSKNEFLIPHKSVESLEKLLGWSYETFPRLAGKKPITPHYGVFCETIDNLPIIGKFEDEKNIYRCIGCGGDGQPSLSRGAYLMPAIMGICEPSDDEKKDIELLSPNRQTLKRR